MPAWWKLSFYLFKKERPKIWMLIIGPYRIGITFDIKIRNLDKIKQL